jgi:hypothetical protein
MDYYFFIKLRRKVPTRKHKLGMDTAVCRAESKEAAVAQLRVRVPALGDARLLPQSERYTEGRCHLRD